jgi:spore coat protein U-like protein
MRIVRITALAMLVAVAGLAGAATTSCARKTPTTITTPQGKVAYQAEDALDGIGALQHAAINARRANVIQTPAMRAIVKATMAAAATINVAIDNGTGLAAAYKDASAGLAAAQKALPPDQALKFASEFAAAQAILAALGGQ